MQIKKKKIIKAVFLCLKVSYLFITRKKVSINDIANSYDKVSQSYQQEYLKTMHVYNNEVLNHLINHVFQGQVLDLAGGTGYNANYLQRYNKYKIDLVDISKQMLLQCENLNINKVCSGMLEYLTKQEDNYYDAIICTWALMYESPQKVFKQCWRKLKSDGYLYILVNDKQTLPQIRKIYFRLLIEHVSSINNLMMDLPTPRNCQQLWQWAKKAGFKKVKAVSKRQDFIFKDWYEAGNFVTSTGALAGYDIMLDLKDEKIFNSFIEQLKTVAVEPCITHHFIIGIFKKG